MNEEIIEELYAVGKITTPHGIDGRVKVFPLTDYPGERFLAGKTLLSDYSDQINKLKIDKVQTVNKYYVLKFEGFDTRSSAKVLSKSVLYVRHDQLKTLDSDEFWLDDLIDCQVYFEGNSLGRVVEIISSPSNDSYIIEGGNKKFILPALKDVIRNIDIGKKEIILCNVDRVVEF